MAPNPGHPTLAGHGGAPERRPPLRPIGIALTGKAFAPCPPQDGKPPESAPPHRQRQLSAGGSPKVAASPLSALSTRPSSPVSAADAFSGRSSPFGPLGSSEADGSLVQQLSDDPFPTQSPCWRGENNLCVGNSTGKVRYDILTIRHWFNAIDADQNGNITKQEWFDFLRTNPKLREFILHGDTGLPSIMNDRFSEKSMDKLKREAKELRRLIQILRELDTDKNGTLEFEEFVEFFRRSGHLQEYESDGHPKARLASIMGVMHASPGTVSEDLIEEFEQLSKWNLHGERRRSLEVSALQRARPGSAAATRLRRRLSQGPGSPAAQDPPARQ